MSNFQKRRREEDNKHSKNLVTGHSITKIRSVMYTKDIFEEHQDGFKKGKSATYHTLRKLKEKYYKYNRDLYMLSVDLKQSYYSINHGKL